MWNQFNYSDFGLFFRDMNRFTELFDDQAKNAYIEITT